MTFTEQEVEHLIHSALNQGMSIRENQLRGFSSKSGKEILNEWWTVIKNRKRSGLDITK